MATILQQLAKEQFPGTLLIVSKVRVSPDLGVAKIYVSIFPVAKTKESSNSYNSTAQNYVEH